MNFVIPALTAFAFLATASGAFAQNARYEVTISNITKGQAFTPALAVLHKRSAKLLRLGQPATAELEALAEGGNTGPLDAMLSARMDVGGSGTGNGMILPGQSGTITVEAAGNFRRLSLAGMLLPTNDTFLAVDSLVTPKAIGGTRRGWAVAYDAGTEANDQNCLSIPGPLCGGEAISAPAAGDEGYIHISNGFHMMATNDGMGNPILQPEAYDWKNPVAEVTITRVQ